MAFSIVLMLFIIGCNTQITHCQSTMEAFVAVSSNTQQYESSYPVPLLGDLHRLYRDLPCSCEYLVKVMASSVNPADITPTIAQYPHVLGSDIAGVIVAAGSTCIEFKVGDRIWGDIGANTLTVSGARTKELGGYSEFTLVLETQIIAIPGNIDFMEAGALPKVALTSYKAFFWYAGGQNNSQFWAKGPTVLVLGGSGGTGTTGIQIARAFGARFIITTTSTRNIPYCTSLGADQVIDYTVTNWWDLLAANTVDVVYDTVGQSGTGERAMKIVRAGGYFVTIAGALAPIPKPGVTQHAFINSDSNLSNKAELTALNAFISTEKLRMKYIQSIYPIAEVASAFGVSKNGHVTGKLSINCTQA